MPKAARLPRNVRAVVFDMDGLLFDTEVLYRDAVLATATDGGHDVPLAFYLSTIGLTADATRVAFNAQCGETFDFDRFWAIASTRFRELTRAQLRLKAGVTELLDLLDELRLPRAIATSSESEDVGHHLGFHGLLGRFDAIVARGDYSRGKPDPEPFLKAAERLGVESRSCLALEDSPSRGARGIGRRNDDNHGARPVAADRRDGGTVHLYRSRPARGPPADECAGFLEFRNGLQLPAAAHSRSQ